ncbi:hypothetical protein QBC35DRAFT_538475 [Podospora australis]|uniref:Azaphilone pigments biosynthesis cluster protein L N-terminal domain-containing protein n=1 Tax=Podospora australis TaxID=1536484 RepID=A0AAN7AFA4_9PEZI|nr:hypothetical protein QBC35DRAFT_538475 [Podospora australis]
MADPLSITGSSIAVVQIAAKAIALGWKIGNDYREVQSDVGLLTDELYQLQSALEPLQYGVMSHIPQTRRSSIRSMIFSCEHVIGMRYETLENCTGIVGRVKWASFGKAKVNELRLSLQLRRATLSLELNILTTVSSKSTEKKTRVIEKKIAATRKEMADLKQRFDDFLKRLPRENPAEKETRFLRENINSLTTYAETSPRRFWDTSTPMHCHVGQSYFELDVQLEFLTPLTPRPGIESDYFTGQFPLTIVLACFLLGSPESLATVKRLYESHIRRRRQGRLLLVGLSSSLKRSGDAVKVASNEALEVASDMKGVAYLEYAPTSGAGEIIQVLARAIRAFVMAPPDPL